MPRSTAVPTATSKREAENAGVDADVGEPGDVGRLQRGERPDPGNAIATPTTLAATASTSASARSCRVEPAAVRADRQPHGQLALARRGPRQVQIRHVEAGNREEQDRGAEEQQQDRTRRGRQRLAQGHGGRVGHPRAVAVTLLQCSREGADLVVRRADGDAARHARDDARSCGRSVTSAAD